MPPPPALVLPTLALAVPSGVGDARCSLPSLSNNAEDIVFIVLEEEDWRGCEAGAGDFRMDIGGVAGIVSVVGVIDGAAGMGADVDADGVSNSTGLVLGVACTLVINLALAQ